MYTPSNIHYILTAAYQPLPPLQAADYEPNFQNYDSIHILEAPNALGTSLSSSSDTMFSSYEYSSDPFCNCSSNCNHTSTSISFQSHNVEMACPPEKPDQDDAYQWLDWIDTNHM
jgi:hypothetical protein